MSIVSSLKLRNKILESQEYLDFINQDIIELLSKQFSTYWNMQGISLNQINNFLLEKKINSKIQFVQTILEIWEKNYCTFFRYGRITFKNNLWYYVSNNDIISRKNNLDITLLSKDNGYTVSLIEKINELEKENQQLKIYLNHKKNI